MWGFQSAWIPTFLAATCQHYTTFRCDSLFWKFTLSDLWDEEYRGLQGQTKGNQFADQLFWWLPKILLKSWFLDSECPVAEAISLDLNLTYKSPYLFKIRWPLGMTLVNFNLKKCHSRSLHMMPGGGGG